MIPYQQRTKEELQAELQSLQSQREKILSLGLKLDMSRGKPGKKQLALSMDLLTNLQSEDELISEEGIDTRNYGVLDGLLETRRLIGEVAEASPDEVFIGGNASLNLMYTVLSNAWTYGVLGSTPWGRLEKVSFLCPSPGYDRHFAMTGALGITMIPVAMTEEGPDMDQVESLLASDPTIKGMWCVPKYSNPDGYTYSDETVRRLASLKPLSEDFRIFYDNAYILHHLDFDHPDMLLNLRREAVKSGKEDMIYEFMSTSKMVFPGHGISAFISSKKNISEMKRLMSTQTIGYDKISQLRHVRFFRDRAGMEAHMKKHAALLIPRFQTVSAALSELEELGVAAYTKPRGGYFISLYTMPKLAKAVVASCKEMGVSLTAAGAAYPNGHDPQDRHIRIAPTYPAEEELKKAAEVLVLAVKLCTVKHLLESY